MAFESYDLLSLRNEVKTEFGIATSNTSKDSIINKCVNDAIRWIIRRNDGLWPWQLKDIVFNVQPRLTGTLDATQGSASATWVSGTKPTDPTSTTDRQIIAFPSTEVNLNDGMLVADFADPTITLDAQYTGATASGLDYALLTAYYILPEDYQSMRVLVDTSVASGRIIHRTAEKLEWLRRDQAIAAGTILKYSIVKDPLPENGSFSNRQFLLLYPYPGERITIRGIYTALHQDLSADADVPLIPQQDRDIIFRVANWMFAMKAKDADQIGAYKQIADESVMHMLRSYDLAKDETDVDQFDEIDIGPVMGPPNLPDWRLP
jgi:hypothetical protein